MFGDEGEDGCEVVGLDTGVVCPRMRTRVGTLSEALQVQERTVGPLLELPPLLPLARALLEQLAHVRWRDQLVLLSTEEQRGERRGE